ncbi:MAG TPA: ASPIC/UnbV domain-containing protein, partial [Myxococcales bacterium]|nr:ASPIC/UnbV domain-containing protein [Myxococcales bacterium]
RDNWTIELCRELPDPADQRDCAVAAHYWTRILLRLPASGAGKEEILAECAKIPADFATMHDVCAAVADSPMDYNQSHKTFSDEIPSVAHSNLLFAQNAAAWSDDTSKWGAGYGGWTWNAKFADVDNDTWQDLFIAQGTRLRLYNPSNVLYRNRKGAKLTEATDAAGLDDHLPTASFLFLDYDLDGDLDIITYPLGLTPAVWRNDSPAGAGLEVRLDDQRGGNRYGVGARVEIRAPDGRLQMRDIKASGGHQSHDLLVARFGLGDWPSVSSVKVAWPDGTASELAGAALASGRYRLVRRK